jgi:hypothetical protein
MNEPLPQRDERDFFRVVKISTALGMGGMAAFLYSLKQVHPEIHFRFTAGTVLMFFAVAIFSWIFCGVLAKSEDADVQPANRRRFVTRWVISFVGITTLATCASFAYSLKNVESAMRREVVEGTLMAVVVLGLGGLLIWKAFRFFEQQSEAELADRQHDEPQDED